MFARLLVLHFLSNLFRTFCLICFQLFWAQRLVFLLSVLVFPTFVWIIFGLCLDSKPKTIILTISKAKPVSGIISLDEDGTLT